MQTRGDIIDKYRVAFQNGTEGKCLLETIRILNDLHCSNEDKERCLREEIDHIICGYMENKTDN